MNTIRSLILILYIISYYATNIVACGVEHQFLINCGLPKSTNVTSEADNCLWHSDEGAKFSPLDLNSDTSATNFSAGQIPYTTARIFQSPLTYSFPVSVGSKFLRLYFSTFVSYNNIPPSQFFLSLDANNFTLFRNFSPFLNNDPKNRSPQLVYEFLITVQEGQSHLNLTFYPGNCPTDPNPCHGFVNGIEIVPVPDQLYTNNAQPCFDLSSPSPDTTVGCPILQNTTSFQTAYRLNVGGADVEPTDDSGGMGRTWLDDVDYLTGDMLGTEGGLKFGTTPVIKYNFKIPKYVAPPTVYATERIMGNYVPKINLAHNLTWSFKVDPGFDYLLRLHFCEMDQNVTNPGQRLFNVYINYHLADSDVDVYGLTRGLGIPIYKNYVVHVDDHPDDGVHLHTSNGTKLPLILALHPVQSRFTDVLLNGLEIFKSSQANRNLAAPNPPSMESPKQNSMFDEKRPRHHSHLIAGCVLGVVVSCIALAFFVILYKQKAKTVSIFGRKDTDKNNTSNWVPASTVSGSSTSNLGSYLPSDLCRRFSFAQIRVATSDFDEASIIGTGGFGKVYKGSIDGGATTVAIKRLNPTSKQGAHEFLTEIEMLSRLRHLHLVSLIGYCEDQREMILVYEYMPRGTLRDHLMYKNTNDINLTPLSWNQRLMICVGSARGLHYLHSGTKELIIHRDVKSTNILLDDKWTAKVSDFGLSKVGPASETGIDHVSTAVKGSIGYLDPEYYKRQRLTEKSDVYSFGVVLFEVLCGRPAANPSLPKEQVNLALWARSCYQNGTLYSIVDPNLTGQIAPECLSKFGEIAEMCVRDKGSERPSMGDVVWALEFTMQLQETAEKNNVNETPFQKLPGPIDDITGGKGVNTDDDMFSTTVDSISQSSDTRATRPLLGNGTTTTTSESSDNGEMRSGLVFSEILNPQAR